MEEKVGNAPARCTWFQDGEAADLWSTGCGHYFEINEGTPSDNDFAFCCFCGKPLDEAPWEDEDDEHEEGENDEHDCGDDTCVCAR